MNRSGIFSMVILLSVILLAASCAKKPVTTKNIRPQEKMIVGKWKPVKVEKFLDEPAAQAQAGARGGTPSEKTAAASAQGGNVLGGQARELERLIQLEERSTLEIRHDKTAVKELPGKTLDITWKMKGKGSKIIARGVDKKTKYVIDIEEVTSETITLIQRLPAGNIKTTYERYY